jgi:hypothetical protein
MDVSFGGIVLEGFWTSIDAWVAFERRLKPHPSFYSYFTDSNFNEGTISLSLGVNLND